jgi:hypothetical protein
VADTWNKPEQVFGADAKVHPITGRHIENGSGAGSEQEQVQRHIREVEATNGKIAADDMRRRLKEFDRLKEFEGETQ